MRKKKNWLIDWLVFIFMIALFVLFLIFASQEKGNNYFDGTIVKVSSDHMIVKATSELNRRKFGSGNMLQVDLTAIKRLEAGTTTPGAEVRIFYKNIQKRKNLYTVVVPIKIQPNPLSNTYFLTKEPVYVPDGFYVKDALGDGCRYTLHYVNDRQESIHYQQYALFDGIYTFHIDRINTEQLTVRSHDVFLFYSANQPHLYWEDENSFYLLFGQVDEEELLKMCESLLNDSFDF